MHNCGVIDDSSINYRYQEVSDKFSMLPLCAASRPRDGQRQGHRPWQREVLEVVDIYTALELVYDQLSLVQGGQNGGYTRPSIGAKAVEN